MRRRLADFCWILLFAALPVASSALAAEPPRAGAGGGWTFAAEAARSFDAVGLVLIILLVAVVGMGLDLFGHLRVVKIFPEDLLAALQDEMANGEYEKALELCEKSDSLVGEVFSAALAKTDYSFERMREALATELAIQALVWRQWVARFRLAAVGGFLAGLLGALVNAVRLLADLYGRTDIVLSLTSSIEIRSLLYGLLTSLGLGTAIALASLVVYAVASAKLEKILLEAGRLGEELLDPFRPLPAPGEE